jgi:hypothetical protein
VQEIPIGENVQTEPWVLTRESVAKRWAKQGRSEASQ